jgi:Predicted membrane protein (DUF2339)
MSLSLVILLALGAAAAFLSAPSQSEPLKPEDAGEAPNASPRPRSETKPRSSLESLIGSRILPGFGAILVLLGFGYLLDYSIEREWITPARRVLCGLAASIGIAGLAQIPRVSRLGIWSDLLAGLGFGGAYLTLWYAGESQAAVLSSGMTLVSGHLLTALALTCGLARNRPLLVSAALVAGFFVPHLLGYAQTSFLGYFGHGLALAGAALLSALIRDHRGPRLVAFAGMVVLALTWMDAREVVGHSLDIAIVSWTLFFFGLLGGIGPALLRGRENIEDQISLVAGLLGLGTGLGFAHESWTLGVELIIAAAMSGGLCVWLGRRRDAGSLAGLRDHLLLGTVAFASLAPAAVLGHDPILGPFWCLEGAFLLALASRRGRVPIIARVVALAMVAAGSLSLVSEIGAGEDSMPLLRLVAWLAAALGAAMASELSWRISGRNEEADSILHLMLAMLLGTVGSVLYGVELIRVHDWADMGGLLVGLGGTLALLVGLALRGAETGRHLTVYAGQILYLPLALFGLLVLGAAELPSGLALLIPFAGTAFVSLAGYAFFRISENLKAHPIVCATGLVSALLFTMIAIQILVGRLSALQLFDVEWFSPLWWATGLIACALYQQKKPTVAGLSSCLSMVAGGLVTYLIFTTDTRSAAALFCDQKFLGLLVWCGALTFAATRILQGRLQSALALLSQVLLAILFLVEIHAWADLQDPQFFGLGAVSPVVAGGIASAVWGLHATLLIVIGLGRELPTWRIAGLGLFLFTAIKVLAFDLAVADTLTRVIAALVVGGAMLGASFFYARRERKGIAS